MVPGIRIEVTATRTAVAITTDGDIGIATLEGALIFPQAGTKLIGLVRHFRTSAEPNVTAEAAENF